MDYDPPLRYLARVYLQNAGGTPGASAVGAVREALEVDGDFHLGVLQQFALDTGQVRNGIGLTSTNGAWTVSMTSESIDIMHMTPIDGPPVEFLSFVRRAAKGYVALMQPSNMKASRIAAVSEGMLPAMSEEQLDSVANRLLNFPSSFRPAPWEWDWRCVSSVSRTFGSLTENTNSVAIAKRFQGSFSSGLEFDRIRLDIDINTHADDKSPRFSSTEIEAFFSAYPMWYTSLMNEILAFIKGDAP